MKTSIMSYVAASALALAAALLSPCPADTVCGLEEVGTLERRPDGGADAYFRDDMRRISVEKVAAGSLSLSVERFERQSTPVYVIRPDGRRAEGAPPFEKATVALRGPVLRNPAWVDLASGKVARLPDSSVSCADGVTTIRDLPVGATPVMVASLPQIPLRIVWEEMTPAEIVDALYRPNQRFPGWVKLSPSGAPLDIKMDVSGEPWAKMATKDFLPCFDKYGQFKYREWPGKTHSDAELAAAAAEEERDLAAHPGPKGRDAFGGWSEGPKLKATGRFRTEKVDGKWWLVDPLGNLFWSWGPVRVTPSSAMTPLNGNPRTPKVGGALPDRDCLFEGLPAKGDPLAAFYDTYDALLLPLYLARGETRRYDFSSANLFRKYGEKWFEKYADSCHRRLRSWGANTIANSSDLRICLQDRTPYAERVECRSRPIEGSWGGWFKFRDPFDPSFTESVAKALSEHGREAHDAWCIGFFIDNEIQWGVNHEDLARWTLWSPDDQPAKVEFLKRLAAKGIAYDADRPDAVPAEELRAFTDVIVEEYFRRTRAAVKAFDPGLLYLGCRFAGAARPWVIGPCARHCDVVSYNVYSADVDGWRLPKGIDAPVLIGEFHFGAHDRGLFGSGLVNMGSQERRAEALKRYVRSALDNPQMVGAHWHQFSDQATSGRFDGECFQVGWTDICDRPYPETVRALRELGDELYHRRSSAAGAAPVVSEIALLEGERWWGGAGGDGQNQPYGAADGRRIDLRSHGHTSSPLLVSSCGRYVWSEKPFGYEFKGGKLVLDSDVEKIEPVVAGKTLKEAYLAAAKAHMRFEGKTPPDVFFALPQWNNWIEISLNGMDQKAADDYTADLAESGFPCGVYMMDGGWLSHQGSYEFYARDFPDPKGLFDRIRSHGWIPLIWTAHFVSPDSREYKRLRHNPKLKGLDYLAYRKTPGSKDAAVVRWWSGISAVYDLTKPEANAYYAKTLHDFADRYGIKGFKFDAGDPSFFVEDCRFHDESAEPVDYTRLYAELAAREFPYHEIRVSWKCGGLPLVTRLNDRAHAWTGRSAQDTVIPQVVSAGLLGCPYLVADMVGGGLEVSFVGKEIDEKLFVRSAALQSLMPMMQFSLLPTRRLSPEGVKLCRAFADLHVAFAPYILEQVRHAAKTGEPVVRAMEYEFPHQGFNRPMQQFMLGDRWLVAPVLTPDDAKTVELPAGRWRDDLGETIEGPKTLRLADVPLSRLPRYERIGG